MEKLGDVNLSISTWKTILPFFLVKTHSSSFFVDYGFLPNTVCFQPTGTFFFQQHVEQIRVYYGLAPLRSSCGCDSKRGGPPFPGNSTLLVENHLGGGTTYKCRKNILCIYRNITIYCTSMRHRNQPSIDTFTVDTMGNQR